MILVGDGGEKSIIVNLAVSLYRSNTSYDNKLNRDFKHFLIYLFFSSTCTLSD